MNLLLCLVAVRVCKLSTAPKGKGIDDGFQEDDSVEPEGLVLDIVEVVLKF